MIRRLEVAPADAGQRVDVLVGRELALSRARLKTLFDEGQVRVDGRRVKKGQAVAVGQSIEVEIAEAQPPLVAEPDAPLVVLRVDEQLVFVDKPAHTPVHPLQPGERGTVANALVARYPECELAGGEPREAGLVHRLDVETSGVLLAARTKSAWLSLRAQFSGPGAADGADKRYLALVSGPLADEGEIELALVHRGNHVRPSTGAESDARPATSRFQVLRRQGVRALVEVQILTGVLHQVRAHLAAVGAPIVGDSLYGGESEPRLKRLFLHAASLEVTHPATGQRVAVSSPLPPELAALT